MKNIIKGIALLATIIVAQACNNASKPAGYNNNSKTDTAKVATATQAVADTTNTADVFKAYITLKDDFLKSDVAGIKKSASALETKLAGIKGCTETALTAHKIAADDDIKAQRASFLLLSTDIIALVKGSKFKAAPIYVDYCPMADEGKGGYWLSLNKIIENPYFPEHMKECGQVKEQIN